MLKLIFNKIDFLWNGIAQKGNDQYTQNHVIFAVKVKMTTLEVKLTTFEGKMITLKVKLTILKGKMTIKRVN